jgi:hypothetical protein
MLDIADQDVGGARVRRTFTSNGRQMKAGDYLTADEFLKMPIANRRALSDAHFVEVFPKPMDVGSERFIAGAGGDKFNVIEGRVINDKPLSREEAKKLAHGN